VRAFLHEEDENGMVLELVAENPTDATQLTLFVQQSGALFFQAQSWNDPATFSQSLRSPLPGCSWVSIAIDPKSVRVRERRGFFQRLFAWAERVTRPE
jgi:hypothetical protein